MTPSILPLDVAIIGGALCGWTCALEVAKRRRHVTIMSEERNIAATYNNTAIGQSGLLQIFRDPRDEKYNSSLSTALLRRGLDELTALAGHQYFYGSGVVDVAEVGEEKFIEAFLRNGFTKDEVSRMDASLAQSVMGSFFSPHGIYYTTPDKVFDVDGVTHVLKESAIRDYAVDALSYPKGAIQLVLDPEHPNNILISAEGQLFSASCIILAAGMDNMQLVQQIGHTHNLEITRIPLVRLPYGSCIINTKVFYKFSRNGEYPVQLAAVHGAKDSLTDDYLIVSSPRVATFRFEQLEQITNQPERLSESEVEDFGRSYPPQILAELVHKDSKVNHGFMVHGRFKYVPDVIRITDTNIVSVIPGLASLATIAAKDAVRKMQEFSKRMPGYKKTVVRSNAAQSKRNSWFRN